MLELSYALTEAQYIAAQRLHISIHSKGRKWWLRISKLIGAAIVLGSLYERTYWLMVGGLIYMLHGWIGWTFTTLPGLMRSYQSSPSLQQENHLSLQDGQLFTRSADAGGALPWSHIIRWAENDACMLLYLQPQLFIIVPKDADAQSVFIPQLREQLQLHERPEID